MKTIILGAGLMGITAAKDLATDSTMDEVVVNDIDDERLAEVEAIDSSKVSTASVDVMDTEELGKLLSDFSLAINALPHELSVPALKAAIRAKTDTIDMVFEDVQMELDKQAEEAGVLIIPGCGFAPGISNVLVKYGVDRLDSAQEAHIKVGGLPVNPEPPLEYKVVFRLDSVWNEYVRKATVVRDGELVEVDPLTDYERFEFPELGELECAVTDGLATLSYTIDDIETLDEKTIRYPGHYDKIKTLSQCGLLSKDPVDVDGCSFTPRSMLTELLRDDLTLEEGEQDVSVMVVEARGQKDGEDLLYEFSLLDYYDEEKDVTSMGRTTAYTSTIVARMLARNELGGTGVTPPENILDPQDLISALEEKNIVIEESVKKL